MSEQPKNPQGESIDGEFFHSRRIVHDNNQIVCGQTVIELFVREEHQHRFRVKIEMWKNGHGGTDRYKIEWIDKDKLQERLKKQAIAGL